MKEITIGFDTSNYTTSCAFFDGAGGENSGRLLDVEPGQLGLRLLDEPFIHLFGVLAGKISVFHACIFLSNVE